MSNLLKTIQRHCQMHLRRGLSIRGRATILNVLILSKLWYILRVIGAPVHTFHSTLCSIIIKFISHQMFPKVSYQTSCLSGAQGGVGLLDPITQQNALQLRWIIPMLDEPATLSEHILCLTHYMDTSSKFDPDHCLLLLDHNTRKQHVLSTASPVSIIYRTMDQLSLTYPYPFFITIAIALQLPATSIFGIHPDHHPKS
ncbi:hypothetical protein INT45_006100 [Circinella minor]|uniref:Uncharacterized protein n=1 Tax=Circinella minor TaxID=1195481 RepID=A0A8H7S5P9_9FUNG|nr:hypothetical protein INT45_006100 [Circinella minor]